MLEKIKEYKELIAIIVFFLGGFLWLENEFPKKEDLKLEIGRVSCLLEKYMFLTQYQIENQRLEKEIQELNLFFSEFSQNTSDLSPSMKFSFNEKKSKLSENKNELKKNQDNMKQVSNELARSVCGKVTP